VLFVTAATHYVINGQHQPPIPEWAREAIRSAKDDIMVRDYPHGEQAAIEAEWKGVYDVLAWLLDPDYDSGWRPV